MSNQTDTISDRFDDDTVIKVTDFKGDNLNSSNTYNLQITPVNVEVILGDTSIPREIEVHMGDGTVYHKSKISHVYTKVGEYEIKVYTFTKFGESSIVRQTAKFNIEDYIKHEMKLSLGDNYSPNGYWHDTIWVDTTSSLITVEMSNPHYMDLFPINISIERSPTVISDLSIGDSCENETSIGIKPSTEILELLKNEDDMEVQKALNSNYSHLIQSSRILKFVQFVGDGGVCLIRSHRRELFYRNAKPEIYIVDMSKDAKHYGYYEFEKIDKIEFDNRIELYAKISYNKETKKKYIENCDGSDEGAIIVGYKGKEEVHFRSDMPCESNNYQYKISFTPALESLTNDVKRYYNPLGMSVTLKVNAQEEPLPKTPPYYEITQNGMLSIDGSYPSFSFDNYIGHATVPIDFIASYCGANSNPILRFVETSNDDKVGFIINPNTVTLSSKRVDTLSKLSSLNIEFKSSKDHPNDVLDTIKNKINNEFDYGYITILDNIDFVLKDVVIVGTATEHSKYTETYDIKSNPFTIFPTNNNELCLNGEDIGFTSTIKDIRFQEPLLYDYKFFDEFIYSIFGDVDSKHHVLGKRLTEGLMNFNSNIIDVEMCNINQFESFMTLMNDSFDMMINYYPPEILRIMNLISMPFNKLVGTYNRFDENYDGHNTRNLGKELDISTYMVSAGKDIVAYEKFSENFKTLNSFAPIDFLNNASLSGMPVLSSVTDVRIREYPLSAYTPEWSWGLNIPDDGERPYSEYIKMFYKFYEHVDSVDDAMHGGIIDFENNLITINKSVTEDELIHDNYSIARLMLEDVFIDKLKLTNL